MNIQQFKYILAVVEYKNFELAADKCFVTQSTLSTMISKFEEELGFKIFDRKKKPVALTREGEGIVDRLRFILHGIDHLEEFSKELRGEVSGNLSISVIPTVAPYLLPLFLQQFANQFPKLKIKVREQTTEEIIRNIKSRELDIGILSVPLNEKQISEIHLYDEPFILYDRSGSVKKKVNARHVDMSNLFLLEEGHCLRNQVLQFCDLNLGHVKNKLNFDFKAGSIDSLMRFVKSNQAMTLIPYLASLEMSKEDESCLRTFSNPVPYRSIGLVFHRHFVRRKILEMLEREIKSGVQKEIKFNSSSGEKLMPR